MHRYLFFLNKNNSHISVIVSSNTKNEAYELADHAIKKFLSGYDICKVHILHGKFDNDLIYMTVSNKWIRIKNEPVEKNA